MSEYGQYITKQHTATPLLSHDPIKDKREARRQLLAEVEQRRKENYKRFLEKQRLQSKQAVL